MNKKILSLIVGILLVGTLSLVSAETKLQMWRNASSGSNVSWVDNEGNWFMSGEVNVTGDLTVDEIRTSDDVSRIKINGDTIVINLQD